MTNNSRNNRRLHYRIANSLENKYCYIFILILFTTKRKICSPYLNSRLNQVAFDLPSKAGRSPSRSFQDCHDLLITRRKIERKFIHGSGRVLEETERLKNKRWITIMQRGRRKVNRITIPWFPSTKGTPSSNYCLPRLARVVPFISWSRVMQM